MKTILIFQETKEIIWDIFTKVIYVYVDKVFDQLTRNNKVPKSVET